VPQLTLHDAAALAGRHAWWEQRLFELAGRWAVASERAEVTVALAAQAAQHAERAEQWHRRLPVLAGWDREALTAAPHDALPIAVARLGDEITTMVDRLTTMYRVLLPARLAAYRAHLDCSSPVCDAPALRVLERVIAALPQEIAVGESLLEVTGDGAVDRGPAAERRARDILRRPGPARKATEQHRRVH
jgi:hypothetical protein